MPPVSPTQAALVALVVAIGNAAVAFGAFDNTKAATVETAVIGLISVAFVIANAIHHSANAKVLAAQKPAVKRSTSASGSVTVGKH